MAVDIAQIAPAGDITYLKGKDLASEGYTVYLIEPTFFQPQAPSDYGPRDIARGRFTMFKSLDDENPEVVENGQVERYLAKNLSEVINKAVIVTLGQSKAKPGQNPAWIWNQAGADAQAVVIKYVEAREAQREADLNDAPDFEEED